MSRRNRNTSPAPVKSPVVAVEPTVKTKKSGRLIESAIIERYPHVIAGSLTYDESTRKQYVRAVMTCTHEHTLATSDLFQVHYCSRTCRNEARKALRAERKAAKAA